MPWSNLKPASEDMPDVMRRRLAYYIHLKTKEHGSKKGAAEAAGIDAETLRSYAFYNYPADAPPKGPHKLEVVIRLILHFGDDVSTVFFAAQHATGGSVFEAMLHYDVYAQQNREVRRALDRGQSEDPNVTVLNRGAGVAAA